MSSKMEKLNWKHHINLWPEITYGNAFDHEHVGQMIMSNSSESSQQRQRRELSLLSEQHSVMYRGNTDTASKRK